MKRQMDQNEVVIIATVEFDFMTILANLKRRDRCSVPIVLISVHLFLPLSKPRPS